MVPFDTAYNLLVVCNCNYRSILYHFRVIWCWIISWPLNLVTGQSRSFEMVPFESLGMVSYSPSMVTMVQSRIISDTEWVTGWKARFFHTSCIRRPLSEYCHIIWDRKTRTVWLPGGKKVWAYVSCFDRIPACDRQTDILRQQSPCYAQHRVVKTYRICLSCLSVIKVFDALTDD